MEPEKLNKEELRWVGRRLGERPRYVFYKAAGTFCCERRNGKVEVTFTPWGEAA